MALSKSGRILILLAIDSVFFLLELVVGIPQPRQLIPLNLLTVNRLCSSLTGTCCGCISHGTFFKDVRSSWLTMLAERCYIIACSIVGR